MSELLKLASDAAESVGAPNTDLYGRIRKVAEETESGHSRAIASGVGGMAGDALVRAAEKKVAKRPGMLLRMIMNPKATIAASTALSLGGVTLGAIGGGYVHDKVKGSLKSAAEKVAEDRINERGATHALSSAAGAVLGMGVAGGAIGGALAVSPRLLRAAMTHPNRTKTLMRAGSGVAGIGGAVLGGAAYDKLSQPDSKKVANEQLSLVAKEAGEHWFQEAVGVPSYYHDKSIRDTFAPRMTHEDAQAELDYLNSPRALAEFKHQQSRGDSIISGLSGGIVGASVAARHGIPHGLAAGAVTALGTKLISMGVNKLTPDEALTAPRKAFVENRLRKLREEEGHQ